MDENKTNTATNGNTISEDKLSFKICPYCLKKIKMKAKRCKYCKRYLSEKVSE